MRDKGYFYKSVRGKISLVCDIFVKIIRRILLFERVIYLFVRRKFFLPPRNFYEYFFLHFFLLLLFIVAP